MIKHLKLRNFTVFKETDLKFSQGLNVIIGENGTGKTHLLKMCYLLSNAWSNLYKDSSWSKDRIESYFSERMRQVFKPDKIGSLTTSDSDGKSSVGFWYCPSGKDSSILDEKDWRFSFSNRSKEKISSDGYEFADTPGYGKSVYLPTKEMVSFFEGFLAAYEKRELQFDETYRDLALHLSATKLKIPPTFIKQELKELSADVGGTLKLEGGKFYLVSSGSKSREITLVAEGIRKIATLLHLLENGSLEVGDTLFWDEPESNLNPKLIKDVAVAILFLCQNGIQVVMGTHSLFLLREIEILSSQKQFKAIPQRYFALGKIGDAVTVKQGNSVDEINPFVMLDEELAQSDRFMDAGND
jgi:AAA15 family ATPase/GTPase